MHPVFLLNLLNKTSILVIQNILDLKFWIFGAPLEKKTKKCEKPKNTLYSFLPDITSEDHSQIEDLYVYFKILLCLTKYFIDC